MAKAQNTLYATVIAALLLAACGGGGGGSPPAAPTLALGSSIKTLVLEWAAVAGATHYRLFEALPAADEAQLGGDISVGTLRYEHTVPLWTRAGAQYRLQACNAAGCTDSAAQTWSLALRNAAIGYVKASNTGAEDQFGRALALSADGQTLAVGAPSEDLGSGAAYVYTRVDGQWAFQAYLKASNGENSDTFGAGLSLSADGGTLVVGAPLEDSAAIGIGGEQLDNAAPNSGAVYVFQRSGGSWSQTHYVKASNTQADAMFGTAVALSGDGNWFVVGASRESGNATGVNGVPADYGALESGAAYVWQRTNTGWVLRAYLKSNEATIQDSFGGAVAISSDGSRVAVGAVFEDSAAAGVDGVVDDDRSNSGAVFLYARDGNAWALDAFVKASNPDIGDVFGTSLALSGDGATLVVGATFEDSQAMGVGGDETDNSLDRAGAAYVFRQVAGVWMQQAYLKASNTRGDAFFGRGLALSYDGHLLAIGAVGESSTWLGLGGDGVGDDGSVGYAGAAYLFERVGDGWSMRDYLKAPNADVEAYFGFTVALSADGGTLAVGATGEASNATGIGTGNPNDGSAANAGAVYLY